MLIFTAFPCLCSFLPEPAIRSAIWKRSGPYSNRIPAPWNLHVIEGGDHSFHVPKAAGTSEPEIHDRIIGETLRWLEGG